jgi:hypothetical protein
VYLTLVNWAVDSTGLQAVPTSTLNLAGAINECVPFPADPGSVLENKFYKLTACTTQLPPAVSSVTGSLCTDAACTACEGNVFEFNATAAALGETTPSPFDPTSASLVTRVICNGETAPTGTPATTIDVVGYRGIGPGACDLSGTEPTQYVPMDAEFGKCSPFLPGVDGAFTNGRFYRIDNCSTDLLNGVFCTDSACTTCTKVSFPVDTSAPCVANPLIPGESISVAGFFCPTAEPTPSSKFFECVKGQCVGSNSTGPGAGPLPVCESTCLNPADKYLCLNGECVVSVEPGRGISKSDCLQSCV